MKYPVREPLRRNGKTHRPPQGEVELDPKKDAAEIEHLTRKGVIGAPGDAGEADAKAQAEQDAKPQPAKPAAKTAKAKE
ncbi:hypothetical protein [Halomonas saccharevitans]|uniref:Uncharacterized protein n=1 Tax=Halomonas saccharevitans TaxID=416872 RepID=A0A1I7AFX9_9GAMM|nr:hypothetical protein [Halomonas saccharevitans]SFT73862.1 hypothetical protein SAMN04487956_11753 [Halomonas saccharevitans]